MKFFRGIAVPSASASDTIEEIKRHGLESSHGNWAITFRRAGPIDALLAKRDLSFEDTRGGKEEKPVICACGEQGGANYYALKHNRTREKNTPIMIEFEAHEDSVAVDGRDFLYTAFQCGDPKRAGPILASAFGTAVIRYAEKAWRQENQDFRIALCDLAVGDPEVIRAHYASDLVLGGRHGTVFRNAFLVNSPIASDAVVNVWSVDNNLRIPLPDVTLRDMVSGLRQETTER